MKWLFVISAYLMVIILILCNIFGIRKRRKEFVAEAIYYMTIVGAFTIFMHATAVLASEKAAVFLYGIYYILADILYVTLLMYVQRYTEGTKSIVAKAIIFVAVVIDAILFMNNNRTGNMFTCALMDDGWGNSYYRIVSRGAQYSFHMVLGYMLFLCIIASLSVKIIKSPKIYKSKYFSILGMVLVLLLVNFCYLLHIFIFDPSVIIYALLVLFIYYYSMCYVPRGLIEGVLRSAVRNMVDGVICFDMWGTCVYANATARKLFHIEEKLTPIEEYFHEWLAGKDVLQAKDAIWKEVWGEGEDHLHLEIQFRKIIDSRDRYIGCFFNLENQTEEVHKLEEERYRVTHDELTGIYSQAYFYECTERLLKEHPDETYYIVCSDVKNFKLVNDVYGTGQGDILLKYIAGLLKDMSRENMTYGRMAGDRFVMCLPKKDYQEQTFLDCAKKASEAIGNSMLRVHMHIGVYEVTDPTIQVSVMCDRAYLAIKKIKNSYSQIISYYNSDLRAMYIREQNLVSEFDEALASGSFNMYIQPQVSVEGKVLGGEALVRWKHRDRGMIPPVEFIGVFEQTGLISRLDRYIWQQACEQLSKWKKEGKEDYHISVNISPKDFYFMDIYETLTQMVEEHHVDCKKLKLEITETALMSDVDNQLSVISRLRDYGFAVEIDDFGSGYSSLNTLKDINVDTLKIDMGFLRETVHIERSRDILTMIVALSKKLGIEVVTEGVETKEQVEFLKNIGCDIFQGYYFAKPMPVSEFENDYMN